MQKTKECLLIDDDQDDQEIFKMCIKKIGKDINCTTIGDAPEAIAMLQSEVDYTPDYIFLDVNMPKMNGVECLRILKQIKRLNKTKIYMYSTTSSSVNETRQLGADDFIIKPSKVAELKEKLSKIFTIVSEINKSE